jgi:hypothetical protein
METKEWITIIGFVVVITSWFVISSLNRKNEIAKERMKFRLGILSSYLDLCAEARENVKPVEGGVVVTERFRLDLITSLERLAIFEGAVDMSQAVFVKLKDEHIKEPFGNEMIYLRNFVVERMKDELGINKRSNCWSKVKNLCRLSCTKKSKSKAH